MGLGSLLTVAFVVLKLTHVIDWSWVWVTSPFWGGVVLYGVYAIMCGIAKAKEDSRY